MEKKLKPTEGYLVIKPIVQETKTASGIILAEKSDIHLAVEGEVIAINGENPPCKVGDTVVYQEWSGKDWNKQLILKFEDIMAVVEYV